jgi:hypothetical protein
MINTKQDYRNLSKNKTNITITFDKKIIISNKITKIQFHNFNKNIIISNSVQFIDFCYDFKQKIKIPKNVINFSYSRKSNIIYKINTNNFVFLKIWNNKIKDVSALGNVYTLLLFNCQNIKDVSALGNVYTLHLFNCQNIKDVSTLGNVHTLNLMVLIN